MATAPRPATRCRRIVIFQSPITEPMHPRPFVHEVSLSVGKENRPCRYLHREIDPAVQNYFLLINPFAGFALSTQDLIPCRYAFPRPSERFHARRLGAILLLFALSLPVYAQEFIPERVFFPSRTSSPTLSILLLSPLNSVQGFALTGTAASWTPTITSLRSWAICPHQEGVLHPPLPRFRPG